MSTARRVVAGSDKVGRLALGVVGRAGPLATVHAAEVNGALGFVVRRDGVPYAVLGFSVAGGRVIEVDVVMNPEKLRNLAGRVGEPLDPSSGEAAGRAAGEGTGRGNGRGNGRPEILDKEH